MICFWKHRKHDDHTMIMVWIMENVVIIPWLCHASWQSCQQTWPPCRHHGMIMTMFRHDLGMIMARSFHGSHVFPNRVALLTFLFFSFQFRSLRAVRLSIWMSFLVHTLSKEPFDWNFRWRSTFRIYRWLVPFFYDGKKTGLIWKIKPLKYSEII